MSNRPSDGMGLDELRDEFDWMFEFQSRMAERIRGDADVHNLVDYVSKLESENARLRDELDAVGTAAYLHGRDQLKAENAKLRELVQDFDKCLTEAVRLAYIQGHMTIYDGTLLDSLHPRMRELGVEVNG